MTLTYGTPADIAPWMALVRRVRDEFPGLETEDGLASHEATVLRFMADRRALCAKDGGAIVGILLYSTGQNSICCLAVAPEARRRGIASQLLREAISCLDRARDISVSTYVESDPRGIAARPLYMSFGFLPGEITEEFGCPNQVFRLPAAAKG